VENLLFVKNFAILVVVVLQFLGCIVSEMTYNVLSGTLNIAIV